MPERKNIQRKSAIRPQQASRSKPVPEKLGALIKHVNSIPPQVELSKVWENLPEKLPSGTHKWNKIFGEALASLLPDSNLLLQYVWQGKSGWSDMSLEEILHAVNRFEAFRDARSKLYRLIDLSMDAKREQKELSLYMPLEGTTYLTIDERGVIDFATDLFTNAVRGEELARIRSCPACYRVFWAGRITQKGCSARCGDIIRKRRYRERYREGFYQGAKLTLKEQEELKTKNKTATKKGK